MVRMRVRVDLSGMRFGKLMVVGQIVVDGVGHRWLCQCDCGNKTRVHGYNLRAGNQISCGCARKKRDTAYERNRPRKGDTKLSWESMLTRCINTKSAAYADYGGRGITFDPRWLVYENFLEDMGERPKGTTLDRYPDNNGNYEKSNCRWASAEQQARNRRNTRILEMGGVTKPLVEWCAEYKMPIGTVARRIEKSKMTLLEALTKPLYSTLRGADFYRKRKSNRTVTAFGQTKTLVEWSEEYNIAAAVLGARITRRGMTPEQALTTPLMPRGVRHKGMKSII